MKRKLTWFDRLMTAITFAEANEHDTALRTLGADKTSKPSAQPVMKPLSTNA